MYKIRNSTAMSKRAAYYCEHTLLSRSSKARCLTVKYYYTKGKAGAGIWKMK